MTAVVSRTGQIGRSPLGILVDWRRAWLAIDTNPAAVAYARTLPGLAVIHGAFLIALGATLQLGPAAMVLVAAALAGCALFPARRLLILVGASLAFVFFRPFRAQEWGDLLRDMAGTTGLLHPLALQFAAVAAFLVAAFWLLEAQRRYPQSAVARRPVLAMMAGFFGLVATGLALEPGTTAHMAVWSFAAVWASCFWFLAYALADQKARDATPNLLRAAYMRPFWGGDAVPFGKGHAYLAKFDARNEDELAATRLKALKLGVWAAILSLAYTLAHWKLHGWAALPTLDQAIIMQVEGNEAPLGVRWASLLSNYFLDLMLIAVWGHALVAVVRMAGWRIPRNTVNPLASRSLAEFWNRYYYYFKELVVDFFFYPAFLRWFKKSPKLRIAFATFCAAGIGNFLYHFMRETHVFANGEVAEMMPRFLTYAFYVSVLSAGLIVSQLRGRKPKPEDGFIRYHVLPRMWVMAFFCFLKIFDDIFGIGTLADRFVYLVRLFGV